MFNLFSLLLVNAFKPAMPLTNVAIDETPQHFAPLSDDCLLQLVAVWGPYVRLDERDVLTPQVRRCSWLCVTARRPAADIRARCQRYSCRM